MNRPLEQPERLARNMCPNCGNVCEITTERRPDGDSECGYCGFKGKTSAFQSAAPVSEEKEWPRCIAVYDREEFLFVTDESHIPAEAFGIGKRRLEMLSLSEHQAIVDRAVKEATAKGIDLAIADCRRILRNSEVMGYLPAYTQALKDAIVCLEPMAERVGRGEYPHPTTAVAAPSSAQPSQEKGE